MITRFKKYQHKGMPMHSDHVDVVHKLSGKVLGRVYSANAETGCCHLYVLDGMSRETYHRNGDPIIERHFFDLKIVPSPTYPEAYIDQHIDYDIQHDCVFDEDMTADQKTAAEQRNMEMTPKKVRHKQIDDHRIGQFNISSGGGHTIPTPFVNAPGARAPALDIKETASLIEASAGNLLVAIPSNRAYAAGIIETFKKTPVTTTANDIVPGADIGRWWKDL